MNKQNKKQKGFTLMELMIVVAIAGIIASIALPSYYEQVKKSRRTDAKVTLLTFAQLQESFFVQNLSYAKDLKQLKFKDNKVSSAKGLYEIQVSGKSPAGCNVNSAPPVPCLTYHMTATRVVGGAQASDVICKSFRIDNVGRKLATGTEGHVISTGYPSTPAGLTAKHSAKGKECWNK